MASPSLSRSNLYYLISVLLLESTSEVGSAPVISTAKNRVPESARLLPDTTSWAYWSPPDHSITVRSLLTFIGLLLRAGKFAHLPVEQKLVLSLERPVVAGHQYERSQPFGIVQLVDILLPELSSDKKRLSLYLLLVPFQGPEFRMVTSCCE